MYIPTLEPRFIFGLRTGVRHGVQYISDSEAVYLAGSALILHNFATRTQRFFHYGYSKKETTCLAVSIDKSLIAVADKIEEERPQVTVYESLSLKRKKTLLAPPDSKAQEFYTMQFTHDKKFLVAILGEPDWIMLYYSLDNGKIESCYKDFNPEKPGPILEVLPNPTDATIICTVGPGLFRLLGFAENAWRPYGFSKSEKYPLTSLCWLGIDRVLASTSDGRLLLVEFGELKIVYDAANLDEIDLKTRELEELPPPTHSDESLPRMSYEQNTDLNIRELIAFSRGFVFVVGIGTVILFQKESSHKYVKRNVFKLEAISEDEAPLNEDQALLDPNIISIQTLNINPSENVLLATTGRSQLYTVPLWGPDMSVCPEILFTPLGESLHEGPIIALSVCLWKTIFLTCGQVDNTVRIWNYSTEKLELSRWFQEDTWSASLHPSGLYAIVGFSDKLRYMEILIDEIKTLKKFSVRECKVCSFSTNGHLFAAVDFSLIHIYSSITCELMISLRGHNGRVSDISWNDRDDKLVSCGLEGAVYEWDTNTGRRVGEIIEKSCQFSSVCVTSDGNVSYAVGNDGLLREISQSQVIRDVSMQTENLKLILSHSDLMLFMSGGNGSIMSLEFPLQHVANFNEYHIHNKPVTAMCITFDDLMLITCSQDGSIILWKIKDMEGKVVKIGKEITHFNDILITKDELEEKNNSIRDLKLRMQELTTEHSYQEEQVESAHTEKVAEIHASFSEATKELKELIELMEVEHTEEINNINADIAKMKENFEATIATLEASNNSKLIIEYDKYSEAQKRKDEEEQNFLQQLHDLEESKKQAIKKLTDDYDERLHVKQMRIEELLEEAAARIKEHAEIKNQIEDDADRDIIQIKTNFEDKLKEERDLIVRLRGEIGATKKKLISSQKEIEESKYTISTLNGELRRFIEITVNQESHISDLKREIHERDATIQEKESRIYELKRKNQELEKYKFVLTYKTKDLKNQIEPKAREIRELKQQMTELEDDLESLQKINTSLELQDKEFSDNLMATHQELNREISAKKKNDHLLDTMRRDIYNASNLIQEPKQLKDAVKDLYQKCNMDAAYTVMRKADKDVSEEFMRQRKCLEETIRNLKKEVIAQSNDTIDEDGKVMEENNNLIKEVTKLRNEVMEAQARVRNLQSLLGLSSRYMDTKTAQETLQNAVKTRAEIKKEYEEKMQSLEVMNRQLQEDVEKLKAEIEEASEER